MGACDVCGAGGVNVISVKPDRFPGVAGTAPFGRVYACGPCVIYWGDPICDAHGIENHGCEAGLV